MAPPRRYEVEDLLNRPGTYFNPTTEVMVIVDDGQALDAELFEEGDDGGEWVLLGDDVPVDESARDELVERFEVRHHPGPSGAVAATEDDPDELDEGLEPDEDDDL
jgi:GT2 family glycosyltransferase